jgi:phosphatidylinositol 4-kinase
VLLALCETAPKVNEVDAARVLVIQLLPYLLEAHEQVFAPSPFLRLIEPSPWEALTYSLVTAALAIGIKFPTLHKTVYDGVNRYIQQCRVSASRAHYNGDSGDLKPQQTFELGALSISIHGFLEAASIYFHFYTHAERLELLQTLRQIFSESFMVSVEGAFSAIRTSESNVRINRDWRQYVKHYASRGNPLGAMLLQRGYMRLLVSCSSLLLSNAQTFERGDLLGLLMSEEQLQVTPYSEESSALVELLTEIATEEMSLLEDGADYLQLGSAWQQRLAFTVKGFTLMTFLCCTIVDEEVADFDMFMSWLEDTISDPVQMADDDLACIVLKSMAIIAKSSPNVASGLSRSLPRFIVQGNIKGDTVIVAAQSLAFILNLLSQDALITGLWSLGNVLSEGSVAEKALGSTPSGDGSLPVARNSVRYTQHPTGSAISLDISGEEETTVVYGNVVRVIVTVATTCKDDKITSLALSMLLQKLSRISIAVDLQIIVEAAKLVASGSEIELMSLLKFYDRFVHDAVIRKDTVHLGVVCNDAVL